MDSEKKKANSGTGFAALSTLTTDIDEFVSSEAKNTQQAASRQTSENTERETPEAKKSEPASNGCGIQQVRSTSSHGETDNSSTVSGSGAIWLVAVAVAVGFVLFLINLESGIPYNSSSSSSTPTSSKPLVPANNSSNTQQQIDKALNETIPPVGKNNVLSKAQIRYCLAEEIRLDASEKIVNDNNNAELNHFNSLIDDYNRRCSEYRYRQGALVSAKKEVERFHAQLVSEGRKRFLGDTSAKIHATTGSEPKSLTPSSLVLPTPTRTLPDETVLAIQRQLNFLGYDAGPEDGLFGKRTRIAIETFQRNSGIAVSGIVESSLLQSLREVERPSVAKANISPVQKNSSVSPAKTRTPDNAWVSGSSWYCNEGFRKTGKTCTALVVPDNAWVSGSSWYCNEGFRKTGKTCTALVVPDNAWVSGSSWYCNEGFRKTGKTCTALVVPDNAWVSGSSWYCNEGFRKTGKTCTALVVPDNAWVSGSSWYCNEGYKKSGNKCVSIFKQ